MPYRSRIQEHGGVKKVMFKTPLPPMKRVIEPEPLPTSPPPTEHIETETLPKTLNFKPKTLKKSMVPKRVKRDKENDRINLKLALKGIKSKQIVAPPSTIEETKNITKNKTSDNLVVEEEDGYTSDSSTDVELEPSAKLKLEVIKTIEKEKKKQNKGKKDEKKGENDNMRFVMDTIYGLLKVGGRLTTEGSGIDEIDKIISQYNKETPIKFYDKVKKNIYKHLKGINRKDVEKVLKPLFKMSKQVGNGLLRSVVLGDTSKEGKKGWFETSRIKQLERKNPDIIPYNTMEDLEKIKDKKSQLFKDAFKKVRGVSVEQFNAPKPTKRQKEITKNFTNFARKFGWLLGLPGSTVLGFLSDEDMEQMKQNNTTTPSVDSWDTKVPDSNNEIGIE